MSDFEAKMHQIRFRLGLAPDPAVGAYSAPSDPLAGFKWPTLRGKRKGEVRRDGGGRREVAGRDGRYGKEKEWRGGGGGVGCGARKPAGARAGAPHCQ